MNQFLDKVKEISIIIFVFILDIGIAFFITHIFGIQNMVVFKTMSFVYGDITVEILIVLGLALIESIIYEYIIKD